MNRSSIACATAMLAFATVSMSAAAQAHTAAKPAAAKAPMATGPQVFNMDKLAAEGRAMLAKAKASPGGSAGQPLTSYGGYFMTLNARVKNGGGEFHKEWNDILIVLDGEGTELTGGTMLEGKDAPGGEVRGTRLEGAESHPMKKGDFIFIPAGTNHQQLTEHGQTLVVLAIKISATAHADMAGLFDAIQHASGTLVASGAAPQSR